MSYFADFMLQMLETKYSFTVQPNGLDVSVRKPVGLKGLTLAFARDKFRPPHRKVGKIQSGTDFFYVTLDTTANETHLFIPAR
jgi:hypothetical protein